MTREKNYKQMTPKLRVFFTAIASTLFVDQITKLLVELYLAFGERFAVIEGFFYLTHVRNPGAAFGFLADAPSPWRLTGFVLVAIIALSVVISFFRTVAPGDRRSSLALGLVLGGGAGNLVDRLTRGEVVDFLHFRLWGGFAWPDFNFADVFIVVGVAALMLDLLTAESLARAGDGGEQD